MSAGSSVICKQPIKVVSHTIGVCKVTPNGKDCSSSSSSNTGHMHQIRVHLEFLDYPEERDSVFNHVPICQAKKL